VLVVWDATSAIERSWNVRFQGSSRLRHSQFEKENIMRAITPYVAWTLTGAVLAHSMSPTVAAAGGQQKALQCDVRLYAAGIRQSEDCSGGSAPPKAAAPLTIANSTVAQVGGTYDYRTDSVTDVDCVAGLENPRWSVITWPSDPRGRPPLVEPPPVALRL
jgi:hypothetical protein